MVSGKQQITSPKLRRRGFLRIIAVLQGIVLFAGVPIAASAKRLVRRARPGELGWPSKKQWSELGRKVGWRLVRITAQREQPVGLRDNPFYRGDQISETQINGWAGAWTSSPSVYGVAAETVADIANAVTFAADNNLRLVVKGGGHSYLGTSNAPDSLLVWTHKMKRIVMRDAFIPLDCSNTVPVPAVTVEAGALWMDVYDVVTTRGNRYVQGGGCATVGVAGLVQSGGFGSFSKQFGLAAGGLLEAEIVTADGRVRTVNQRRDPELFWALKGGGGGTFGVVSKLTLATHELPEIFGDVSVTLRATTDAAHARLIRKFFAFYAAKLYGPNWGESVKFHTRRRLEISMVFSDLAKDDVERSWQAFISSTLEDGDVHIEHPFFIEGLPARTWWDVDYLQKYSPGSVFVDSRPGAPKSHAWWQGDQGDVGIFLHGYTSLWLPSTLLKADAVNRLADALQQGSQHWTIALHFNKGLAGAPRAVRKAALSTATNPQVVESFALAIVAGGSKPEYRSNAPYDPYAGSALADSAAILAAAAPLRLLSPGRGSYLSESDYFEADWKRAYWGANYRRLLRIKEAYDPHGLFFAHNGVGSECWSTDGFTRLA